MSFIETPLPEPVDWIRHFERVGLPALAHTVESLAELRGNVDNVSPRNISDVVVEDPLMSLKVLIWANKHLARNIEMKGSNLGREIQTVETAIVSIGITSFFLQFIHIDTVEARLAKLPEAQFGLSKVLQRSLMAADFARDWAAHRNDMDIQVIAEGAMLHDVAEMLVWVCAPTLAMEMQMIHKACPRARTADIQKSILGITLNDLEAAIMRQWHLSSLLKKLTDNAHAETPQVLNAVLAARLARHLANSTDDPALPDDFAAIAKLLRTSPEWVRERVLSTVEEEALPM
jgi:HD-like signal output (HDOD) protein